MVIAAVRNTQDTLVCLVKGDFQGKGNFFYWVVALLVFGALGYIDKIKPLSDAILVLIIVALFLTSGSPTMPGGGFFKQFSTALQGQSGSGLVTP